ncbi:hypothetical protein V1512DRAFT_252898 [Lipomyces arxii]|uniref:uncharacterized protein n=1 Tax=Lipomyces arxii TaxID=56418 RepID=UPI0034CDC543
MSSKTTSVDAYSPAKSSPSSNDDKKAFFRKWLHTSASRETYSDPSERSPRSAADVVFSRVRGRQTTLGRFFKKYFAPTAADRSSDASEYDNLDTEMKSEDWDVINPNTCARVDEASHGGKTENAFFPGFEMDVFDFGDVVPLTIGLGQVDMSQDPIGLAQPEIPDLVGGTGSVDEVLVEPEVDAAVEVEFDEVDEGYEADDESMATGSATATSFSTIPLSALQEDITRSPVVLEPEPEPEVVLESETEVKDSVEPGYAGVHLYREFTEHEEEEPQSGGGDTNLACSRHEDVELQSVTDGITEMSLEVLQELEFGSEVDDISLSFDASSSSSFCLTESDEVSTTETITPGISSVFRRRPGKIFSRHVFGTLTPFSCRSSRQSVVSLDVGGERAS